MSRSNTLELSDILKKHKQDFYKKGSVLSFHKRTLNAIELCRTVALGGHLDRCDSCTKVRISYNSCRNRHCPKCQVTNKERWILDREAKLIPTNYFHVVFTLPHELNSYCLKFPKQLYNILFEASKETLETFAADEKHLGAKLGMISVLHTWGQNLSLHPHVHIIVPGGGISKDGAWKTAKNKGGFLFPTSALSVVFKNKFMEKLGLFLSQKNFPMEVSLRRYLYNKNWIVYSKKAFGGPNQVIEYLGRYTHKIAISNGRLISMENGKVKFYYKDYADKGKRKVMELPADEFLRRFCLHILPRGFTKIRHYGILSSRYSPILRNFFFNHGDPRPKKPKKTWKEISKEKLNFDIDACPCCKTGKMIRICTFAANAPPSNFTISLLKKLS